jgi:hypothetical protein
VGINMDSLRFAIVLRMTLLLTPFIAAAAVDDDVAAGVLYAHLGAGSTPVPRRWAKWGWGVERIICISARCLLTGGQPATAAAAPML